MGTVTATVGAAAAVVTVVISIVVATVIAVADRAIRLAVEFCAPSDPANLVTLAVAAHLLLEIHFARDGAVVLNGDLRGFLIGALMPDVDLPRVAVEIDIKVLARVVVIGDVFKYQLLRAAVRAALGAPLHLFLLGLLARLVSALEMVIAEAHGRAARWREGGASGLGIRRRVVIGRTGSTACGEADEQSRAQADAQEEGARRMDTGASPTE